MEKPGRPLIVIVGATSKQAVASLHCLKVAAFSVALTRNSVSPAHSLSELGVEILNVKRRVTASASFEATRPRQLAGLLRGKSRFYQEVSTAHVSLPPDLHA